MTAREYIDEIKLRLNRLGVTSTLNDPLILNYVNKARRDVQMATLSVMPERYGRRDVYLLNAASAPVDVDSMVHIYYNVPIEVRTFQLPPDYIDVETLWIGRMKNGRWIYREARRLHKKEFHNVKTHCFNIPHVDRPVFVIDSKQYNDFGGVDNICYIAGLEENGVSIFNAGMVQVEIWAIVALSDFDRLDENENVLSIDLQEYAVKQAMVYCLNDIDYIGLKQSMVSQVETYKRMVIDNYRMLKQQPIHQLPSQEGV